MRESERRIARRRLRELVRRVRRRWRMRLLVRGLAWTGAVSAAVLLASALGLERARYAPEAVVWLRVLTWGTVVASFLIFVVRPLLTRVDDIRAALYLEEHEPSLELAVLTALEAGDDGPSHALSDGLVQSALERLRAAEDGSRVERDALRRTTGALVAVTVAGLLVGVFAPPDLRYAVGALLTPTRDADTVNPYAIAVTPGDTTISRGSDQMVWARLQGFESGEVTLFVRDEGEASFRRLSMLPADDGRFELMLLGVAEPTEYFVESSGIRSPTYRIAVADLPYVDRLDLTITPPAYTGMDPVERTDGGDVVALPGTVVEVRVHPTMPTPGGRLEVAPGDTVELESAGNGTLVGRFTVRERSYYHIQLARDNGELVPASPEYAVDVLEDHPPGVFIVRPGRDRSASPIEEVFVEVRASDDYGVRDVRLVVSVNGGAEDTVQVFRNSGAPLPSVSAGHTLFLEEWPLEPGDLVSYYALVRDNRPGATDVASDIYFLTVRPFDIAFREGEQQAGAQGQQGGQPDTPLSELQRQIIAATFNLIRQRENYDAEEFSENVVSVQLAQARLREQVSTLLQRMMNRGLVETDPGFRDVAAILPRAVEAMEAAEADLGEEELREALPDEQTALRHLQQAEETYERYVTQQQQQAGGQSAGQRSAADDLADLFELEVDKLQNQYETVRRGENRAADDEVDELMERLRELARRQEQAAERQRRAGQATGAQSGQAAQAQRQLAEEAEEAARRLERLAREQNDPEMQEAARALQQAAEAMRRAAADGSARAGSEANSALRRLEDARRRLEEARAQRAQRDAQEAMRQVDELQRQQREVQRRVRELPEAGAQRRSEIERLRERKNQMTEAVANLEAELDEAAARNRAENPEAARALQEAARQIRESKLKEKLQYSRGTIEEWDPQSAATLELSIEGDLQALRDRLEEAAGAVRPAETDPLEEALDETRDLVRAMEAMRRRLEEAGTEDAQAQGEPGRQGDAQQEGEQGRQGEQGGQQGADAREGDRQGGDARQAGPPTGADAPANADGRVNDGAAPVRGNPRPLRPEEVRQFAREFAQRLEQARRVRDQLREAGRPVEELEAVLDAMARLDETEAYRNREQVAELQEEILRQLKMLEFGLRREVEGGDAAAGGLRGSDEVPEAYRALVEEYYRALAKGRGSGGTDGR